MDKRRKVYKPNIKRADALTLWAALNNVTTSQAGNREQFYAIAQFAEGLGEYFAFTEADAIEAEAQAAPRNLSALHGGRPVFLYR